MDIMRRSYVLITSGVKGLIILCFATTYLPPFSHAFPQKNLPTNPHPPQAINNDMFLNDGFSVFNLAQNPPGT